MNSPAKTCWGKFSRHFALVSEAMIGRLTCAGKFWVLLLVGWVLSWPAQAEFVLDDLYGLCPDAATGPLPLAQSMPSPAASADRTTVIQADRSESLPDGEYRFSGNVEMSQQDTYIKADKLRYHRLKEELEIRDHIYVERDDFAADGDEAFFALQQESGFIRNTHYRLLGRHARGEANEIRIINPKQFQLQRATYTTCMSNQEVWRLNARSVDLDYQENVGSAKHVWLNFMDVPVVYFPYLSFPIAGRKSGLLMPEFASSSSLGSHMSIPWYWNIAPNQDATFTLHPTSVRGTQYLAEYRFLTPASNGVLTGEVLPNDQAYDNNNPESAPNRYYYALKADARLGKGWSFATDARDVSDTRYFSDFGDRYASSLINHMERNVSLNFQDPDLSFQWRAVSYRTLDRSITAEDEPYQLLPQVSAQSRIFNVLGMDYRLFGELSRFYRRDAVWGDRYRIVQDLSYLWERSAFYLRPRLFHTALFYDLNNNDPAHAKQTGRLIPGTSLDSGLYLERDLRLGGKDYLQTLEPRLFYLYVPYQRQDNLILRRRQDGDDPNDPDYFPAVFDAGNTTLSYSNMFLENRFSGGDRVGDANQLAFGLNTRLIGQETGRELLNAGIGRIFYFQDQEVTLPEALPAQRRQSDIFGVAQWRPEDYYTVTTGIRWDSYYHGLIEGNFQMSYHPVRYNVVNIGYRMTRNPATGDFDQLDSDISTVWKIATRINIIARRNRPLLDDLDRDVLAGFEYEDCCWAFRLVRRRYLMNNDVVDRPTTAADYNDSVMFQLVFKGLTSVGSSIDGLLRNDEYGITGY